MTDWDVIVVGAGMGGATLGHALAQAGHRVLFVEKGAIDPRLRGIAPESSPAFAEDRDSALREAGRSLDEIEDRGKRFRPFIGNGGGGSSALYGMAMERFFREDFTPRRHHRDADTTLPE